MKKNTLLLFVLMSFGVWVVAQSAPLPDVPDCTPERLANQQDVFAQILPFDFATTPLTARDNLFRLGAVYQQLAIDCGYQPSEHEINALIQLTLAITDIETIVAASSVGDDVDAILIALEEVNGDSFNGQLLYNGMANALDGTALGCAGCHVGEVAPPLEGTFTRIETLIAQDPQFADYTIERYLVESIVRPDDYIPEGYLPHLMPNNYGTRLDLQQLADLVAYLASQDQLED